MIVLKERFPSKSDILNLSLFINLFSFYYLFDLICNLYEYFFTDLMYCSSLANELLII